MIDNTYGWCVTCKQYGEIIGKTKKMQNNTQDDLSILISPTPTIHKVGDLTDQDIDSFTRWVGRATQPKKTAIWQGKISMKTQSWSTERRLGLIC